jgi:2,4-dienoyl-CoA reductase (NADPH2)
MDEGVASRLFSPLPRVSSSALRTWGVKPKEMTKDDIKNMVKAFAKSAKLVKQAGFDAVEVHGGTGYLISQFISPIVNQRKDEYGGSIQNRMRFPLEVVDAVMEEVGDYPVGYRFMADEGKGLPEGLHIDESSLVAEELEKRGIAYLSVIAGSYDAFGTSEWQEFDKEEAYLVPYAEEIKKVASKTPIITAGRIQTPADAIRILEEGKADLIGLARILYTDPLWVKKAEGTVKEPIVKCDPDCYVCEVRLKKVKPAICIRWPKERLDGILARMGENPDDVYNYLGKPF